MTLTEEQIRSDIAKSKTNGVFYRGISNEDYHKGPGISSSNIKTVINETIGAYLEEKANPKEQTPALKLGTAIHTRILEPDLFKKIYSDTMPEIPARRGETKKIYEEWEKEHLDYLINNYGGKLDSPQWAKEYVKWKHPELIFLSEKEMAICEGAYKSWSEHPEIQQIFSKGEAEISLYWIDEATGLLCKARPDWMNPEWPCLPDIKSCQMAGLDEFEGDITTHDYHVSAAWYLDGAQQVFGMDFKDFVYIPIEKKPPYQITYYPADMGSVELGRGLCKAGLFIFQRYFSALERDKKVWTGHSREVKPASCRPWAFNKLSQVIAKHDLQNLGLEQYVGV